MPSTKTIEIVNNSEEKVYIFSLYVEDSHIHIQLFGNHILPFGNLTMSLTFLPKKLGQIQQTLEIDCSVGKFLYEISGFGIPNPYHAKPLISKLTFGMDFQDTITLFNPFPDMLEISEVLFSHCSFLNFKPIESNKIPPFKQKKIIVAQIQSLAPRKYQGLVFIRTTRDNLTIPVEMIIFQDSLNFTQQEIDFGTIINQNGKKTLPITLLNSNQAPIHLKDLYALPNTQHLSIEFFSQTIEPKSKSTIAHATFTAVNEGTFKGKITLITNHPKFPKLNITYKANVIFGSLNITSNTAFHSGSESNTEILSITNNFLKPITIYSAYFNSSLFRIMNFTSHLLQPGEIWNQSSIQLSNSCSSNKKELLNLFTNIGFIQFPFCCYNGKLKHSVSNNLSNLTQDMNSQKKKVDFGSIAMNSHKTLYLLLKNENPVNVSVLSIASDLNTLNISIFGLWEQNLSSPPTKSRTVPFLLEIDKKMVISLRVCSNKEEQVSRTLTISTSFEEIKIPISYTSLSETNLHSNPIETDFLFSENPFLFPITVQNTNSYSIGITNITSPHFLVTPVFQPLVQAPPRSETEVGFVKIDLSKDFYSKYALRKKNETNNNRDLTKTDLLNLKLQELWWQQILKNQHNFLKTSIDIQTDFGTILSIPLKATIVKPSIFQNKEIDFSVVKIGKPHFKNITVYNPSFTTSLFLNLLPLQSNQSFEIIQDFTPAIISPRSSQNVGIIQFFPSNCNNSSSILHVKNNMTILDSLNLFGKVNFLFLP